MMPVVIDHTQADVQSKTEKGYYNCTDLNRVGHNVEYLAGVLNGYGYLVSVSQNRLDNFRYSRADMTLYLADQTH